MTKDDNKILLITKCLSEEATNEELMELKVWTEKSKENMIYFQKYKNIWDISGGIPIEKKINVTGSFELVKKRVEVKAPSKGLWHYWKNIAAIFLIPLLAGNIIYFILKSNDAQADQEPVYNEIFAAFGTRSSITLSDGSSLWLNSGSSLRYPVKFIGDERKVYLNGEAYFEVESNPKKPFIVETSSLTVRATGTKFNVSGYDSFEESEITLVSGKVEVCMTDNYNNLLKSELNVNQHLSFNKAAGTSSIKTGDTYKYVSWKDGKLIFRDEPLRNVVKRIGQIFNIDIELRGAEIQDYTYRATFEDESLEEILKLLKASSPVDYLEVKREPLPDHSFPKKKVIIFQTGKN